MPLHPSSAKDYRLITVLRERGEHHQLVTTRARDAAAVVGASPADQTRLATVLSELLRSLEGPLRVGFSVRQGEAGSQLLAVVHPEEATLRWAEGAACFDDLARLVTSLEWEGDPPELVVSLALADDLLIDAAAAERWGRELVRRTPGDPLLALERQNRQLTEITQQLRRAERAAAAAAREQAALVQAIPVIVWWARADGSRQFISDEWREQTGTDAKVGLEDWLRLVPVEARASVAAEHDAGLRAGEPFEQSFALRGADGEPRWFLQRVVPLCDEGGAVRRWFGSLTDVDESKRREEESARAAAFMRRMMSIVGHDLRAPLAVVSAAADLLELGGEQASARERAVSRLRRANERAGRMIGELLDYTRTELGDGIPCEPTEGDLVPVLADVLEQSQLAHPSRPMRLVAPDRVVVSFDRERLAQAVTNLIQNAVTHGRPESSIRVVVEPERDRVRVAVCNQGEPVPPDVCREVFEPFRQTESGRKKREGLGLGLFIVRAIARAHGGDASMRSSDEGEVQVAIHLPLEGGTNLGPG